MRKIFIANNKTSRDRMKWLLIWSRLEVIPGTVAIIWLLSGDKSEDKSQHTDNGRAEK